MEKEFVPYTEALQMKELRYNGEEECLKWWVHPTYLTNDTIFFTSKLDAEFCFAPLYQQAFRWFRDVKGLFVSYNHGTGPSYSPYIWCVSEEAWVNLINKAALRTFTGRRTFDSYPEAELACLQQLIKIVQDERNPDLVNS